MRSDSRFRRHVEVHLAARGLTDREFAATIPIPYVTFQRYLVHPEITPPHQMRAIARALGVPYAQLIRPPASVTVRIPDPAPAPAPEQQEDHTS